MIVGCYTLHLYCDDPGHVQVDLTGKTDLGVYAETGPQARQAARQDGWRLDMPNDEATCPPCVRARRGIGRAHAV